MPVFEALCLKEYKVELKDFIASTMVQIIDGINEANQHFESNGVDAAANPSDVYPMKEDYNSKVYGHIQPKSKNMNRTVHKIDFDVAVFASEEKETKGGIGIMVASVGLGSQGKSQNEHSSQSRIQFSIPLMFPEKESNITK